LYAVKTNPQTQLCVWVYFRHYQCYFLSEIEDKYAMLLVTYSKFKIWIYPNVTFLEGISKLNLNLSCPSIWLI
jgi:hypothetical protein